MTTAVTLAMWQDFCALAGMELATIDHDTTLRRFESELRWNAVYYRVAQGLQSGC